MLLSGSNAKLTQSEIHPGRDFARSFGFRQSFGQPILRTIHTLRTVSLPSSNQQRYPITSTSYSPSPYQRSPRHSFYDPPPQGQAWTKLHLLGHQLIYPIVPSPFPQHIPRVSPEYPPQPDDSAGPNFGNFARRGVVYQTQTHHKAPHNNRPMRPQQQPTHKYEQDFRYQNGAAS